MGGKCSLSNAARDVDGEFGVMNDDEDEQVPPVPSSEDLMAHLEHIRKLNPGNLTATHLTADIWEHYEGARREHLWRCISSAVAYPEAAGLGCYAIRPNDYATFKLFFERVISDYHHIPKSPRRGPSIKALFLAC